MKIAVPSHPTNDDLIARSSREEFQENRFLSQLSTKKVFYFSFALLPRTGNLLQLFTFSEWNFLFAELLCSHDNNKSP
jgi:hypothetical protein